jgi:acyl-CoA synthetase (AMP-forming)/AMP-acid ligase II
MIDYWKVLLWEKYEVRPGHSVAVVVSLTNSYYVSLVIACLELGVSLAVTDRPIYNDLIGVRQRLYGPMQLSLFDNLNWVETQVKCAKQYFKYVDQIGIFNEYNIQDNSLWNKIAKTIFASPDSVAITTTTSGTSGTPKVVKHTHEWILDSSIRTTKILNFNKDEIVLHNRQLSHGSLLDLFLLPSLMICNHHVVFNYNKDNIDEFVNYVVEHKVNKFIIFSCVSEILDKLPVLTHKLNIISCARPPNDLVDIVKQKNIHSFTNSYGSTESGNNILVTSVTPESDAAMFNPYNFGPLRDDHYSLTVYTDHIEVEVKKFNKKIKLNDRMVFKDGNYYFYNKSDQYRINDVFITEADILHVIATVTSQKHDIVIDVEYDSIYIAFYEEFDSAVIDQINQALADHIHKNTFISKTLQLNYETVTPAHKPLKDIIRNYARTQIS